MPDSDRDFIRHLLTFDRNASDPQIRRRGLTLAEAKRKAAQIYEPYGYWSSVCSAIVSAATIASN